MHQGSEAIRARFAALRADGFRHAVVDAVFDQDLIEIGHATSGMALVTGGSGIAMGLPDNFRARGNLSAQFTPALPGIRGRSAVLAGSCSKMTRAQIARTVKVWPSFNVDPRAIADGRDVAAEVLSWAGAQSDAAPILIYSSADPAVVTQIQNEFGRVEAGEMVEQTMGTVARGLMDMGVNRLVVAGGETSGAVVKALDVRALRIGPEIDPGVPWTEAIGGVPLALALKSGNFGAEDFFEKSLGMLP